MKSHAPLAVVLLAYALIGALFATRVPAWQVPDEPAHYNYVAQLVRGQWPEIEPRDWTPGLTPIAPDARAIPVERITYQDHQPPLYYALQTPVFAAFGGSLTAMRLWSLTLGAIGVLACYLSVLAIFPGRSALAGSAAAFYALLPQHLHILAGVNNDALSEALLGLTVWQSLRIVCAGTASTRAYVLLGITVGLALFTKAQAYLALPFALLSVGVALRAGDRGVRDIARAVVTIGLVACVLAAPLWARNILTFGGLDFLGLQRHNAVVVGQPTTADWLTQFGLAGLLTRLIRTTFQSFWGQFGWMSVLNDRLYWFGLALTVLSTALFLRWWATAGRALAPAQSRPLTLLLVLAAMTVLAYGWYNLQFVQHQGRYLYTALIPISMAFGLAWTRGRAAAAAPYAIVLLFAALNLWLLFRVILPAMG
jgi:4-amino-4-deoxy-L-arabinose transferase-like glycosyltransferase